LLSFIPFNVNKLEAPGIPKMEKLPEPPKPIPSVFMIAPGAVWAMYVRSFPGFGTSEICVWFMVVETSPFSA
jgi:hypothetical protein